MRVKLKGQLRAGTARNLLKRLKRDQRGNVLFIAAAAILPLIGLVGSSVDMGRAYMAKLRLQQACDSGALAGRRAMAHGGYTTAAQQKAYQMFAFNFPNGVYGTRNVNFVTTSNNSADVTGIATAILPTSIMFVFGFDEFDLSVACGAKLEIANTDIMMVLDVTGSMDGSKLTSLKSAANLFLTTLMSADAGGSRIRIGVVPYALTVNMGGVLEKNWISDKALVPSFEYKQLSEQKSREVCISYDWWGRCNSKKTEYYTEYRDQYTKKNVEFDVSGLKNGGSANFPIGEKGGNVSVSWSGCVTEVATQPKGPNESFDLSEAFDMNINHVPSLSDDTKWKMYLPRLVFEREGTAEEVIEKTFSTTRGNRFNDTFESFQEIGGHTSGCPVAAMKLTTMDATGRAAYTNKISSLKANGYTYHDAGIAWGARLISPNGIFKTENEKADNGKPISRHIIFMTDGLMDTSWDRYSHQGVEKNIPRVGTIKTVVKNNKGTTTTTYDSNPRHNNRFLRLCNYARAEGVTIWVVAFGFSESDKTNNADYQKLTQCADPGLMYSPNDGQALAQVFASIAGQIARLRVSQ